MTVHIGVVGTGMIGQDHIRRLTEVVPGAAVVAVTDIDSVRANEIAASVGARALPSGEEVINDSSVDAVLVTSWGPTHAEYVLAAISAGKPVFCEKPLATSAADGLRILKAEQEHGRQLVRVGFMRRSDPGYQAMKQVIEDGSIGRPLLMHCVHRNVDVPQRYHSEMATQDTAVHEVDVIRWLLGEEISTAQVVLPRSTTHRFEHLRDPQILLFETVSGVRIDLEVFVNCRYGYDIRCETVGETGTVSLPDPAAVLLRSAGAASTRVLADWQQRFAAAFDTEFLEWVDSVRTGQFRGPSSWDGYAATVTCDATVVALHSGTVVPVQLPPRPDFYAPGSTP